MLYCKKQYKRLITREEQVLISGKSKQFTTKLLKVAKRRWNCKVKRKLAIPKKVTLLNGRTFCPKYERVKKDSLLPNATTQRAITCSKLTIEILEQGVKHAQS